MNIFLWLLQITLALHTATGAFWKFSNPEQTIPSLKIIPHGIWMGMSIFELFCSLCLLLPSLAFMFPNYSKPLILLAPVAAIGIATEMLVFCGLHFYSRMTGYGTVTYWLVVAAVCAFIAYNRLKLNL